MQGFGHFVQKIGEFFQKHQIMLNFIFFISISRFFMEIHYSKYSFFISRFEKHPNLIRGSFREKVVPGFAQIVHDFCDFFQMH